MRVNGLGYITTDELHAYEEGLNSDAERLYLNWGEPRSVERLMETTKALQGVILKNPAGHLHFASNWYGGRMMYREGAWEWQKPYSFTVLHAPILLGLYNGSTPARASDLLEINTKISNKTILIPFTRKIVPKVDIQKSLVIVDPPEGLFSND
mgnify:CR=1 FL=1